MAYTGIQRAILKGRLGGIVATRNMFVGQTQLGVGDTDKSLIEGYLDEIFDHLESCLNTIWASESIEIQHLVDGEWFTTEENSYVRQGTGSGDYLPFYSALVFVAKCVGKRLLGRKFWAGLGENDATGNAIIPGCIPAAAAALAHYVSTYTSPNNGVFGPGVIAKDGSFHTFASGVMSSLLGTMRRRKPGLGI